MYSIIAKRFSDFRLEELYAVLKLRQEVFVVEQDCAYLDLDDLDQNAHHFLCLDEKSREILAYARLIPPDVLYPDNPAIGRVVVHPDYRKQGLGKELMKFGIAFSKKEYGGLIIRISAQRYLEEFYTALGFEDTGNHYLEDGIPHVAMLFRF